MPTSRAHVLAALLGVNAVVLHGHFVWFDSRPAVDLGHYYAAAVQAVVAHEGGAPLALGETGSAYGAGLALLWSVLGLHQGVLEALDGAWLAALALGMGLAGHVAGGGRGAVVGTAAVLVVPAFATGARTHWIHHPEVASAVLALGLAVTLRRTAWAALLVGLVAAVGPLARPSALVWCLPPLMVWSWTHRRPAAALAWLPWTAAAALQAPGLLGYLQLRLALRDEMAAAVGQPLAMWPVHVGWVATVLLLALVVLGARRLRTPVALVGTFWFVGGLAVVLVTGAGLDNVPTAFAGLALVAAHGAPKLNLWAGLAALTLALVGPLTQLVPPLGVLGPVTGWEADDHGLNWLVPRDGLRADDLAAGAAAICPGSVVRAGGEAGQCSLIAQRGLVHPSWEDDGTVGLVLAGWRGVRIQTLTGPTRGRPDGVITVQRTGPGPDPTTRFPDLDRRFSELARGREPVAEVVGNGAVLTFLK